MSATVCLTVASKVASSRTSTPAFACPRATRPTRLKISDRNAIKFSPPLRTQMPQNTAGSHHIDQQKVNTGQDIVLVFRSQVQELAEVVEGDRDLTAGVVELEVGGRDAVAGVEHLAHDVGGDGGIGNDRADQRKEADIAFE